MKFRDPKTGEMFESLEKKVVEDFCMKINCGECPMNIPEGHKSKYCCDGFMTYKPIEAARLMGYEVVEDDAVEGMCCDCAHGGPCCSPDENTNCADRKEDGTCWVPYTKEEANMGKPRICEVLGVEVGEVFTADTPYGQFKRCFVDEEGQILNTGTNVLCYIINHPDRIIRKPRFIQQEVERAYKWINGWIAANPGKFRHKGNAGEYTIGNGSELWGKENDKRTGYIIIANELERGLEEAGYNADACVNGFIERGYILPGNTRKTKQSRIGGIRP